MRTLITPITALCLVLCTSLFAHDSSLEPLAQESVETAELENEEKKVALADKPLLLLLPPKDDANFDLAKKKWENTAKEYRELGVTVEILANKSFTDWLNTEGKLLAKAEPNIQRLNFLLKRDGRAFSGLESTEAVADHDGPGIPKDYLGCWSIDRELGRAEGPYLSQRFMNEESIPVLSQFTMFPLGRREKLANLVPFNIKPLATSGGYTPNEHDQPRKIIGVAFENGIFTEVVANHPAATAGLKSQDKLVSINSKKVTSIKELQQIINDPMNSKLNVVVERDGVQREFEVSPAEEHRLRGQHRENVAAQVLRDFKAKDHKGNDFGFEQLRGKYVILDFWGPWCGPCVHVLPNTILARERFPDVELVAICTHCDNDSMAKFIEDNQLPGIHIKDDSLAKALIVNSFPSTFIIDKQGRLRTKTSGSQLAATILGLKQEETEKDK